MPIGSNIDVDLPVPGDTYAEITAKLKAAIEQLVELLEAPIDSGALDLTTPLSLHGAPLINVGGIRLVGGESTEAGTAYIDGAGELHVVTTLGDVQITLNGNLNVAALGTIGGDYGGANPATVTYDDTSGEYRFKEDSAVWASVVAAEFIAKNPTVGSIAFGVDPAITTAKTFTIKSLPASGVSGLAYVAADGTVVDANATRETLAHKFTNIDLTGNVVVSNRSLIISAAEMQPRNDGGLGATISTANAWIHNTSGASSIYGAIRLPAGAVIQGAKWWGAKGSATGTISGSVRYTTLNSGTSTLVASIGNTSANNPGATSFENAAINHTMLSGAAYYVQIFTSGQSGDETYGVEITYSGAAV